MPKLARGCYEKIGFPLKFNLGDETFVFQGGGATRMVYGSETRPHVVAKTMPAQSSKHGRPAWDQNEVL